MSATDYDAAIDYDSPIDYDGIVADGSPDLKNRLFMVNVGRMMNMCVLFGLLFLL